MSEPTKACNLTADEMQVLIEHHGIRISQDNANYRIERINYLHKRLKAFNEPAADLKSQTTFDTKPEVPPVKSDGWGSNNG